MVAAICITGIFIYFFIWSIKHKKKEVEEWSQLGREEEKEVIEGLVTHRFVQRKRFSTRYWYIEMEGSIYVEEEAKSLKFIWRKPETNDVQVPPIEKTARALLKGNRRQGIFYANHLEPLQN